MTAKIINLKQVRKARERREDEARADANRAKFGRTRAEREAHDAERRRDEQTIEGHRLSKPDDERDAGPTGERS